MVSQLEDTAPKSDWQPECHTQLQQHVSPSDSYHVRTPHDQKEASPSLRHSPTPPPIPFHTSSPSSCHAAPLQPTEPPQPPTKPVVVPLTMDSVVREGAVKVSYILSESSRPWNCGSHTAVTYLLRNMHTNYSANI